MIEVYVTGTANGQRPLMMLEECRLRYRSHYLDRAKREQQLPGFLAINPVGALPVLVDPDGPSGPITVTQSVAILFHLADKCGKLLPTDAAARALAIECTMFAATDVASAATQIFVAEQRVPVAERSPWLCSFWRTRMHRYLEECNRRVRAHDYLAGAYSIADIVLFSTLNRPDSLALVQGSPEFGDLQAWHGRVAARPALQRGIAACGPS